MTPDQLIEQCRLAIRWAESVKAGTPIEIECKESGHLNWLSLNTPNWRFDRFEYREKTRPLEQIQVQRNKSGCIMGVFDISERDHAIKTAESFGDCRVVHMREVVE